MSDEEEDKLDEQEEVVEVENKKWRLKKKKGQ